MQRAIIAEPRRGLPAAEDLLGQTVGGRYLLTHLLGRARYGAMFHAIQRPSGCPVTVEVLVPAEGREAESIRARFVDEARDLSRLCHPNNAGLLDHGETACGSVYSVRALLRGRTLAAELWRLRRLPPRRAIDIAIQALLGLAEAHARGIVHGHIRPTRLLLSRDSRGRERVKVLDYDVARPAACGATGQAASRPRPDARIFMPPEQLAHRRLCPADDLYALGGVLYAMLTGQPPVARDGRKIPRGRLEGRPRLAGMPPVLKGVICRALARNPSARFGRAVDMMGALEAAVAELDARAAAQRPIDQRRARSASDGTRRSSAQPERAATGSERIGASLGDRAAIHVVPPRAVPPGRQTRGLRRFAVMAAAGIYAAVSGGTAVGGAVVERLQPALLHSAPTTRAPMHASAQAPNTTDRDRGDRSEARVPSPTHD